MSRNPWAMRTARQVVFTFDVYFGYETGPVTCRWDFHHKILTPTHLPKGVGGGFEWLFLAIQLISIMSCITWLSNWCYSNKSKWSFTYKMLLGTIPLILVLILIIFMFIWYAPHRSCPIVVFILCGTILIFIIMGGFAYRSSKVVQVEAWYMNASLMALYVEYICWSTLKRSNFTSSLNMSCLMIFYLVLTLERVKCFLKLLIGILGREDDDRPNITKPPHALSPKCTRTIDVEHQSQAE
ncbi:unnamed protein product [Cuscuta europaea]|uniref:Uncharacterized protein n=1 Tax=Cuscuta europaea TaxID=41803 RepID=A0A9P1DZB8_CUSEU|nr:unnamed protein product [Cuscuta europaea]